MQKSIKPLMSFKTFVEKAKAEEDQGSFDWEKEKAEWFELLASLYAQIMTILKPYIDDGDITAYTDTIEINEPSYGVYTADRLILKVGRREITFTPVATMLIGTKGRVDVQGPSGRARLMLVDRQVVDTRSLVNVTVHFGNPAESDPKPQELRTIDWTWKIVGMPPDVRFIELNEQSLSDLIQEVASA